LLESGFRRSRILEQTLGTLEEGNNLLGLSDEWMRGLIHGVVFSMGRSRSRSDLSAG
jgi:hypothetical protein